MQIRTEMTEILSGIRTRTFGLTFVLSAASLAFAQEKVSVTGKISDKSSQPVPYASITFTSKTSKVFSDAALTDEKGNFKLSLVPGNYTVTIEAIDYKKQTLDKNITAGSIGNFTLEKEAASTLSDTTEIQGVTLTAQSSKPYRVELDKKTYDPSQDIISKGGNLQDVLTNVPSVSVDTDGTVSMRGNSNVKFLINGKPSSLLGIDDSANALQSIPADQIERIEVITNPSSKFEASGTAGILNIILKKSKTRGFTGSVSGTLGYLPTSRLNANLNWRKGNWIWYINGGGGYDKRKNNRENATTYFDDSDNISSFLKQTNDNNNEGKNYNFNTGFNVDITDKTALNASIMMRNRTMDNSEGVHYTESNADGSLHSLTDRYSNATGQGNSWQADLGLDQKIGDNGQNITASVSLQHNKNNDENNIRQLVNSAFDSRNLVDQITINKTFIGKLDYELPIGNLSKLEAGYRIDRNENDYDYNVKTSDDDISFIIDPDFTSNTVYKEMINAFYAQFKSKIDRFGYQLGLRTELSDIDVSFNGLSGNSSKINKNYTGFFPSVFLSYDLGGDKSNQLLLNYSRRINRPRSWFLVPFNSFSQNDDRNLFAGNPDLNPEYVNSFELGYAIQKKKYTINPTLYYRRSQDETQMVVLRSQNDPQVLETRPYNVGWESQLGLDLNSTADLLPWWKIMANATFYRYESKGSFFNPELMDKAISFDGDGFSARARLTNTFTIDKTFNIQLQGFYRGGEKTASSHRKPMYALNLGASKTIWKGNGTVGFNIQDIFNTRAMKNYSYGSGFERYSYMQWQPRQFSVSFTYRFKQGEKIDQPKRKRDNNSNYDGDDEQQIPM
ncbi:TonB-dependent receptor domain-containing protein [Daejeonia sp. YH14]|uniref:TonB-dependent receptor domain-containing protein n=1 Tax=Daejeonia sp. YH14 TaxID=3439042 RepID=UPI003F499ADF